MRQVLIDHSRVKKPTQPITPEIIPQLLQPSHPESSLAAKLVFEQLRKLDKQVAETVWLRCVEGLTIQEMSERQTRETWRVRADYDFGLQWMANRLKRYA